MPEFVIRIPTVLGLSGLLWWLGDAVPDWLANGGPLTGWLTEFPIILPVLLTFLFLTAASFVHEWLKRRGVS
mgnify:CR=1 FL=1